MMLRRTFLSTACLVSRLRGAAPRVAVIAHRGEHVRNPENTIAAIESAIEIGCDFAELDIRTTADEATILMHNATVDATTDGQGKVSDLTLPQIRQLRSKGLPIPTFDEALAVMRGRIGIYVDAKAISAQDMVAALRRHDMILQAVVYGRSELFDQIAALEPRLRLMPEAVSVDQLKKSLQRWKLRVVAFNRNDFKEPIVNVAKAANVDIFVDCLGKEDTAEHWEQAVRMGATGIQTDHPKELVEWLKQHGCRN